MLSKLLISLVFVLTSCTNQKIASSNQGNPIQQNNIMINYEAHSRVVYENITLSEQKMTLRLDRNNARSKSYPLSAKEWEHLMELVSKVNLLDLSRLNPPTSKRLYDGAAHAKLTITSGINKYNTRSFDHGYPPHQINDLVHYIQTLKNQKTD